MSKAFVSDITEVFYNLELYIRQTQEELENGLNGIRRAFDAATESWQDKNADRIRQLLEDHERAMSDNLYFLERMYWATENLSNIARKYVNN